MDLPGMSGCLNQRRIIMGTHKILSESKESLKEYKEFPERYNSDYCKCKKPKIKYTSNEDKKCLKCNLRSNQ